jgi:hypothetical protein
MTNADAAGNGWHERWKAQDAWTASEFAMLCCGWNPSLGEHPDQSLYNDTLEAITRAVSMSRASSGSPNTSSRTLDVCGRREPWSSVS